METMQDKNIREKLNSLDTLPEGYAPSLQSKWELLQAGKPQKQEKPVYSWYAVAASLVLLICFGLVYLMPQKDAAPNLVAKQNPSQLQNTPSAALAVIETEPATEEKAVAAITTNTPAQIAASTKLIALEKSSKTVAKALQKVTTEQAETPAFAAQKSLPAPAQISDVKPNEIAAALPVKTNKAKSRYVEMDFDAPVMPQAPPAPVQTAQVQLKIKLLPQTSETGATAQQETKTFRLQHTF